LAGLVGILGDDHANPKQHSFHSRMLPRGRNRRGHVPDRTMCLGLSFSEQAADIARRIAGRFD
jgi:hypothetical protein